MNTIWLSAAAFQNILLKTKQFLKSEKAYFAQYYFIEYLVNGQESDIKKNIVTVGI